MSFNHIANLNDPAIIPADGILSRTVHDDDQVRVVLFAFSKSEELSEHTAAMPAIIQILHGEADLTLGAESFQAQPGTWIHMPASLPHSVSARTPLLMLLSLLKV
jgi:quercetin dioxygenase-like cupin family protein